MAGLQIETAPLCEPLLLGDCKNYLKVPYTDDDALISNMIIAARQLVEAFTARSLVNKGYVQTLDSFPYFTDTVMSQNAYPPSYYSLPRYSTTLWNYSQMVKLMVSPLASMKYIFYVGTDAQYHTLLPASPNMLPWRPNMAYETGDTVVDGNGNVQKALNDATSDFQPPNTLSTGVSGSQQSTISWATNVGGVTTEATGMMWQNIGPASLNEFAPGGFPSNTFLYDKVSEPPRLFPGPAGSFWPPVMYVPNAVEIHYVAGYGDPILSPSLGYIPPSPTTPDGYFERCVTAIQMCVANWYENREASSPLNMKELPNHLKQLLWSARIYELSPTRG